MTDQPKDRSSLLNAQAEGSPSPSAPWFDAMLSRRQFGVMAAAGAAAIGTGALVACSPSKSADEPFVMDDVDALQVQRDGGWRYGATGDSLTSDRYVDTDVAGSSDWTALQSSAGMLAVTTNARAYRHLVSPTLFQSLDMVDEGAVLGDQIRPVYDASIEEAYQRGVALADTLVRAGDVEKTFVILDLPGPESVAAATGMASLYDPAFLFDNWPHPRGLVNAHETLGAVMYFGRELSDAKAARADDAPPVLVLDHNRLRPVDATGKNDFDNRYGVELPSLEWLQKSGFERVMYVVADDTIMQELDDINEDFVVFQQANLPVARLTMDSFGPVDENAFKEAKSAYAASVKDAPAGPDGQPAVATPDDPADSKVTEQPYHVHRHYHYGMSPFASYFFLMHFAMMRPMGYYAPMAPRGAVQPRRPANYTPRPRSTAFATRYSGSKLQGVGRQRPTGIGRVTTPVNTSTGRPAGGNYGARVAPNSYPRRATSSGGTSSGTRYGTGGRGVTTSGG